MHQCYLMTASAEQCQVCVCTSAQSYIDFKVFDGSFQQHRISNNGRLEGRSSCLTLYTFSVGKQTKEILHRFLLLIQ